MLNQNDCFHFVGIGGAGMSAIAKVLLQSGFSVSGSDLNRSETTRKLESLGAKVQIGHEAENADHADALVVSTAIRPTNPEILRAKERGIHIYHRADIVAELMNERQGIAVAGAHGKTTTTSMVALMLEKAGVDPTIISGGELDYIGGNAKLGHSPYLVAEADESDGSFLKLRPKLAIVTNIENDHMDYYKSMDNILKAFRQFLHNLPQDGLAILCYENELVRQVAHEAQCNICSYGFEQNFDLQARNIRTKGHQTRYDVWYKNNQLGEIALNVPGQHNILNSLAAVAVGLHLKLSFEDIASGLAAFQGAKRRFQTKARINGVWIVDDYAHHPTEIFTTLNAAKQTEPKRLICIFQPHRFSRTQLLQQEFGQAFQAADLLILTDIYAAGETPIPGIDGEVIKDEVYKQTGKTATYIEDYTKVARYLAQIVEPGDLVMTMGAGNIYLAGEELVERMMEKSK